MEDFTWNAREFIYFDLDYYRYLWYYENFNDMITYELVLGKIYKYDTQTYEISILPLDMKKITIFPLDVTFSV